MQSFSAILSSSERVIGNALVSLQSAYARKRIKQMDFQEVATRLTSLEARMNRMERLMQQLISNLSSSQAQIDRTRHLQGMLQELSSSPALQTTSASPAPQQERPEIAAIRQALLAGDRLKAVQLYRNLYGVSLQEAQRALDTL